MRRRYHLARYHADRDHRRRVSLAYYRENVRPHLADFSVRRQYGLASYARLSQNPAWMAHRRESQRRWRASLTNEQILRYKIRRIEARRLRALAALMEIMT
jgi:hypothetical protein